MKFRLPEALGTFREPAKPGTLATPPSCAMTAGKSYTREETHMMEPDGMDQTGR